LLDQLPDQLPGPTIPAAPLVVHPEQGGAYGEPGASALANYQRHRAAEWTRFLRSMPWRLAAVIATGGLAGTLAHGAGPRVAGPAAAVAAAVNGWLLCFRVSADTAAWRRGARGERRTARKLRPLLRAGWTVLHDVAIPDSRADADHLLIGPPGVFVVDTKAWHGHISLGPDGSAWHNGHPVDSVLDTVRWEAKQLAQALGVPILPILCVHDARLGSCTSPAPRSSRCLPRAGWWPPCGRCPCTWTRSGSCCWPNTPAASFTPPPEPSIWGRALRCRAGVPATTHWALRYWPGQPSRRAVG
jgi:hypothetical protein